jgi:hypothetical protein
MDRHVAKYDDQIARPPPTYREIAKSRDREMSLPAGLATTTAAATAEPATATTSAAAAFAKAAGAGLTRTRFVDGEWAAAQISTMQLIDGALRALGRAHLDKRKAARPAGHLIAHDAHGLDGVDLPKQVLQRLFVGIVGQIADIQLTVSHGHSSSRTGETLALDWDQLKAANVVRRRVR